MKLIATISAIWVAAASAACSNQCSGHGTCGSEDECSCFPRWSGPDCSKRECPTGMSWVANADANAVGPALGGLGGLHAYTECSSKGSCDHDSGTCDCYDGFTGLACSRQVCPLDCSGHGRCISNLQYNDAYGDTQAQAPNHVFDSQFWDYEMSRQCACDRGWEGFACDKRICPVGADPLTCENTRATEQYITLTDMDNVVADSGFLLSISLGFEDMYNGLAYTKPIRIMGSHGSYTPANLYDPAYQYLNTNGDPFVHNYVDELEQRDINRIREALQDLPNFAVPTVNVTLMYSDSPTFIYRVVFTNPANTGTQNLMQCRIASEKTDSPAVSPRMSAPTLTSPTPLPDCVVSMTDPCDSPTGGSNLETWCQSADYTAPTATESTSQICSNRGICDSSSGICQCFNGYAGEACSIQTIFF